MTTRNAIKQMLDRHNLNDVLDLIARECDRRGMDSEASTVKAAAGAIAADYAERRAATRWVS